MGKRAQKNGEQVRTASTKDSRAREKQKHVRIVGTWEKHARGYIISCTGPKFVKTNE
jgi:hypothetical protein